MSKYYLIDTNVLLAASGMATQLRPYQVAAVSEWLSQFQRDGDAFLLLDSEGAPLITKTRIIEEYQRKMQKSAFGWQVIKSKLEARKYLCYRVAYEGTSPHEYAVLPQTLTREWRDPADRKFMAVALAHIRIYPRQRCRIVNATDTDWSHCISILRQHFIEVEQLLI
jgi:predicted nucleic acid-binding protein